ncbi:hypothetical protein GCM10009557_05640 [Virgisporangium ochraceum]|uniref:Uncharacterized protein n=1 Tax=Virgisporangium ochraceum TaxID=65505 RepID=A0A8J3ZU55_9ACTN|nr:hypothetical protein Voc01_048760 [Virgisporangium ochraceum]
MVNHSMRIDAFNEGPFLTYTSPFERDGSGDSALLRRIRGSDKSVKTFEVQ